MNLTSTDAWLRPLPQVDNCAQPEAVKAVAAARSGTACISALTGEVCSQGGLVSVAALWRQQLGVAGLLWGLGTDPPSKQAAASSSACSLALRRQSWGYFALGWEGASRRALPRCTVLQGVDDLLRRVSALLQTSMVEVHCLIPYNQARAQGRFGQGSAALLGLWACVLCSWEG